jgi:photosystem II stability/assembly factor-like uncharacterized protein
MLMWPVLLQLSALSHEASITVEAQVKGKMLRGTRDGWILESLDSGKTWKQIANFGKHCSIAAIRELRGQVYTEVAVQGYRFALKSAEARVWYSAS